MSWARLATIVLIGMMVLAGWREGVTVGQVLAMLGIAAGLTLLVGTAALMTRGWR